MEVVTEDEWKQLCDIHTSGKCTGITCTLTIQDEDVEDTPAMKKGLAESGKPVRRQAREPVAGSPRRFA